MSEREVGMTGRCPNCAKHEDEAKRLRAAVEWALSRIDHPNIWGLAKAECERISADPQAAWLPILRRKGRR